MFSGIDGFDVVLKVPRYMPVHHSVVLKCDYDLPLDNVYQVEWSRRGRRFFQFIKNRNPPYINQTIPGATLDVSKPTFMKLFFSGFTIKLAIFEVILRKDS